MGGATAESCRSMKVMRPPSGRRPGARVRQIELELVIAKAGTCLRVTWWTPPRRPRRSSSGDGRYSWLGSLSDRVGRVKRFSWRLPRACERLQGGWISQVYINNICYALNNRGSGEAGRNSGENDMDKEHRQKASTGTYRIRGVSRDVHRAARLRAVSQGITLRWVVLQALQAYGAGTWTPSDKPPGSPTNGI
jgi:hypothetical protein